MLALVQRVLRASVTVDGAVVGQIGRGFLVLVCAEQGDTSSEADKLLAKLLKLRVFSDAQGKMNHSIQDMDGAGAQGGLLLVSQFTLHASTRKGNRPSYIRASKPEIAIPIYEKMIRQLETDLGKKIQTGEFGAEMQVRLWNNGPVTITIDTKAKE
jgi:D-tyrosyl-tRNA(Tyr) deacylase